MYLETTGDEEATGRVAEIYAAARSQAGFVMEATRCFTARPDLLPLYADFANGIRAGFSLGPRAWRLITFVAAGRIPSTCCSLVYGRQLVEDLGSPEVVLALRRDFRTAGLDPREVEMLAYAEQVAADAAAVTEADVARLRAAGFADREICDIALCASWRCFVGRFLHAAGATPDPAFLDGDEAFKDALAVGKPV